MSVQLQLFVSQEFNHLSAQTAALHSQQLVLSVAAELRRTSYKISNWSPNRGMNFDLGKVNLRI